LVERFSVVPAISSWSMAGVVEQVGQGHHLRAGDVQAMLGQDGLPFGKSQAVEAADGEVADAKALRACSCREPACRQTATAAQWLWWLLTGIDNVSPRCGPQGRGVPCKRAAPAHEGSPRVDRGASVRAT
jgi:hypothetical protein